MYLRPVSIVTIKSTEEEPFADLKSRSLAARLLYTTLSSRRSGSQVFLDTTTGVIFIAQS